MYEVVWGVVVFVGMFACALFLAMNIFKRACPDRYRDLLQAIYEACEDKDEN